MVINWDNCGLSNNTIKVVEKLGFSNMTPVQVAIYLFNVFLIIKI